MGNKSKEIDIKIHTCNFLDDIINIKKFDPNKVKIDENEYEDWITTLDTWQSKFQNT